MGQTAGIVVIGDEILSGKFADENAAFLIGAFAELGVSLQRIAFIPDDLDDIADTVRTFSERFDIVVTSGGVGPTHDDLTMAGIARGFAVDVVIHPAVEALLREHWGDAMPAANIRLAEIPAGAELVTGGSSWPIVRFRNVYILPGVPALFRKKFEDIMERFRGDPVHLARIYVTGDEGALAPHLDRAVADHPAVKFGSYPRWNEPDYRIILTVESRDAEALARAVSDLTRALADTLVRVEH